MSRKRVSASMLKRTVIMMVVFGVLAFVPMVLKLAKVQLIDAEFYQLKAAEQQTRDTIITPKRGVIYDRNMNELAVSATAETVYISPADIETAEQESEVARVLSEMLGLDYQTVLAKTQNKKSYYQVIKKKIDEETATALRARIKESGVSAIHLAEDTKRYYPYGSLAAQVLGFCGDENSGLNGIEAMYEEELKGVTGRIVAAKNARGTAMPFQYEEYYDAQNGQNVVLTIDATIQQILEKHLGTAVIDSGARNRGAGIVMDITTGEILALSTMGGFDLNNPFEITDANALKRIEQAPEEERKQTRSNELNAMWRSKIISDSYEPGSTFKILTIAMGVEEGVVNASSTFSCPGAMKVGDRIIHCWKRTGHGTVTLSGALENSCNCALMQIVAKIGNAKFFDYVTAFGLREKTGVDLPGEASGFFFNEKDFKNPNNKVSLAVASFGQTFKVTPIQMITAVSAVVNGGKLLKPHIVKEIVDKDGIAVETFEPEVIRQIVSKETSEFICSSMESVVAGGTGRNASVKGYRIGGKTGTSEKIDIKKEGEEERYVASFLGVAPMESPRYAILIIVDEPSGAYVEGSQVAAPVAGKVYSEILPYLGIDPVYSEEEMTKKNIYLPNVVGMTAGDAKTMLSSKRYVNLKIKTVGDGDKVTDQLPVYGTSIPDDSQVVLYLGGSAQNDLVEVPNVVGMSPEEANRTLTNAGLTCVSVGVTSESGITATKQSVAAGTKVQRTTNVTVEFYATSSVAEGIG